MRVGHGAASARTAVVFGQNGQRLFTVAVLRRAECEPVGVGQRRVDLGDAAGQHHRTGALAGNARPPTHRVGRQRSIRHTDGHRELCGVNVHDGDAGDHQGGIFIGRGTGRHGDDRWIIHRGYADVATVGAGIRPGGCEAIDRQRTARSAVPIVVVDFAVCVSQASIQSVNRYIVAIQQRAGSKVKSPNRGIAQVVQRPNVATDGIHREIGNALRAGERNGLLNVVRVRWCRNANLIE